MSLHNVRLGETGERLAETYLTGKGYQAVERNFRCRVGEIDLILRDGATWVFVEVKTRSSSRYGAGREAVGKVKQAHLQRAALFYLQSRRLGDVPFRFDVVEIDTSKRPPQICHLIQPWAASSSQYFW
jgi:putative endonuclease